jgi:anti-anti-sigma factor
VYFHVRRVVTGPLVVVRVVGEIDLATAPRFRSELVAAGVELSTLDDTLRRTLVVDLSDCVLIDSVGLGVTLGAARRTWELGARFVIVADDRVRRTFDRCRLDELLEFVDNVERAGETVS